jgi:hypothetical protein
VEVAMNFLAAVNSGRVVSPFSTRCYGNVVVGSGANDQVTLEIMYWSRVMAISSYILCW